MTYSRWAFTSSRRVNNCATPAWASQSDVPVLEPIATALRIRSGDGMRLLRTAWLAYHAGDDWIAQRYLFAALVMGHSLSLRPGPSRLAKAEEVLKRLI